MCDVRQIIERLMYIFDVKMILDLFLLCRPSIFYIALLLIHLLCPSLLHKNSL